MHDEHGNIAKKLGNFSIAVTAALLATASGHAATTNPAAEMQASGSQARFSPIAPAGPSHIPTLMDFSQSHRFVDTDTYSISYADGDTSYHNYFDQSK
jgi:hypothetical protein